MKPIEISRRALQFKQHDEHPVYVFALAPHELLKVASISRVSRDDDGELIGYQRDEVRQHIQDIQDYVDSGQVLFPNAIILAFEWGLSFRKSRGPMTDDGLAISGVIDISVPDTSSPPGWIVDGQQRAIALSRTKSSDLPIPVVAFMGGDLATQRDQFLRVNNTRPLPRRLITELLPNVDTDLPRRLSVRKLPSAICDLLNRHPESPFKGLIARPSARNSKDAVVNDTAVVDMIKERLTKPGGCLFPFRNMATGETDTEAVTALLIAYWSAVRDTFPEAWGLKPTRSRLMHGAGIKALGGLMDQVMGRANPSSEGLYEHALVEVARVAPLCRWTSGHWEGLGDLHWKEIENTPKSVRLLTNHLMREYTLALHRS
ncbi:MAG: DGQHR domain-containing protein [Deltaproteobacteria bacterium]|nr:MAG: DGQHR domain-containing protein [Deltaproteobacteria bacterium]